MSAAAGSWSRGARCWGRVLALALGLWGVGEAQAQQVAPEETPPAAPAQAAAPHHQLSLYCLTGAQAYLSEARTQGGVGGGLGLRDTVDDRWLLQADLSYLAMLGNVGSLRLGAGVQWRLGVWTPGVLGTLTTLFGDRLSFLTPQHPVPVQVPAFSLGLALAPLRFSAQGVQVSALELGLGVGTDLPGLGVSYEFRLLEVAVPF